MGAMERHPWAFMWGVFAFAGCLLSLALGPELFSGWVGTATGAAGALVCFTGYGSGLWLYTAKAEGRE